MGMELSWIYAWAAFSLIFVPNRPFPLPEAIGTFGLAAILTLWSMALYLMAAWPTITAEEASAAEPKKTPDEE